MSKFLLALTAACALAACSAAAHPTAEASVASVAAAPAGPQASNTAPANPAPSMQTHASNAQCAIRSTPTAHGVSLEALASVSGSLAGEYHLSITKTGPGGSSDIAQGGPFSAQSGSDVTVGSAEISLERGDHYRAVLILSDANGTICRQERRS